MSYGDNPKHTDITSETAILGSIYRYGIDALIKTEDFSLNSKDFFYDVNANLFYVMQNILSDNPRAAIDPIIIKAKAKALGLTKFISQIEGNKQFLESIKCTTSSVQNVPDLALSVKKNAIFRNVIEDIDKLKEEIDINVCEKTTLEELLCLVDNKTRSLTDAISNPNCRFTRIGEDFDEILKDLEENPREFIGIPTGFKKYDVAIGRGIRRGSIAMMGARTGIGKSLVSCNISDYVASLSIPVLYLDTEMTRMAQLMRFAAIRSGVSIDEVETGKFAKYPEKKMALYKELENIMNSPFYHQYIGGWDFTQILAFIKRWIRQEVGFDENGVVKDCLVVFDYIKMTAKNSSQQMKEYQLLGIYMDYLHTLATTQDIPMLLLVQLNRDGITNETQGIASASDRQEWLASSFAIFKEKTEEELSETGSYGNCKLIVVKSRFGPKTPAGNYINMTKDQYNGRITEGEFYYTAMKNKKEEANDNDRKEENRTNF